jgi:sedoheptulokinase
MPADFILPDTQSSIEYFPYFDNRYLAVAASLNGGNVMASFVRMLQSWMQDLGFGVPQSLIWDKMLTLVKQSNSTEQAMTIIPTLFGERHLSRLPAAEVSNINSGNISLGNVAKALFEGLITNLHK